MSDDILRLEILHFEDEPSRVPYPSLLDVALAEWLAIPSTDFKSSDLEDHHELSFPVKGKTCIVTFRIHDGEHFPTPDDAALASAALHLADWSVGANRAAGFDFYEKLRRISYASDRIWLITGYAHTATIRLNGVPGGNKVRIVAKPAPHDELVADMLALLKRALTAALGGGVGESE